MSEFFGILLVCISILGLVYSLGNLFTINTSSSGPELNSLRKLEFYHEGMMAAKQQNPKGVDQ